MAGDVCVGALGAGAELSDADVAGLNVADMDAAYVDYVSYADVGDGVGYVAIVYAVIAHIAGVLVDIAAVDIVVAVDFVTGLLAL